MWGEVDGEELIWCVIVWVCLLGGELYFVFPKVLYFFLTEEKTKTRSW